MLVAISRDGPATPEEVEMIASVLPNGGTDDHESPWFGQPLRLRAILRDGTQLAVAFSLTEAVGLYLRLGADNAVTNWAEVIETRLARPGTKTEH